MLRPEDGPLTAVENIDPGFQAPRCHATTITETKNGLLLAFFGGEVGQAQELWVMRKEHAEWGRAQRLVAARDWDDTIWNPVLHRFPGGSLLLFYKQGPNCSRWEGRMIRSEDDGHTWSHPRPLPDGIWGPIRSKPLELSDGSLLCPSSTEVGAWRVHFERTRDEGRTWTSTGPIAEPEPFHAIQPTLIQWPSGRLQALCRSKAGCIVETWSEDEGASWSPLERTGLPNPDSAIDAVSLPDGRALLVYNPTTNKAGRIHARRGVLAVAVSEEGEAWRDVVVLEDGDGEYSYPAVILASDGRIHITYTAGDGWVGMRHAVIDAAGS